VNQASKGGSFARFEIPRGKRFPARLERLPSHSESGKPCCHPRKRCERRVQRTKTANMRRAYPPEQHERLPVSTPLLRAPSICYKQCGISTLHRIATHRCVVPPKHLEWRTGPAIWLPPFKVKDIPNCPSNIAAPSSHDQCFPSRTSALPARLLNIAPCGPVQAKPCQRQSYIRPLQVSNYSKDSPISKRIRCVARHRRLHGSGIHT